MIQPHLKIQKLLLILLVATLSNCYTLTTHQSGKTLGKGNATLQGIAGYDIDPNKINSSNNDFYSFSEAQGYAGYGLRDDLDIGILLGFYKAGLFVKHQFVGNLDTRFNLSGGLSATKGSYVRTLLDYNSEHRLELPLYISYDLNKTFTLYSNPVLTYRNTEKSSYLDVNDRFFRGLSNGLMINIPVEKVKFALTLESSLLSPYMENSYEYNITAGLGIKFPTKWSKTPVIKK